MADILLSKPAANISQSIPSAPDSRFVFDFPAGSAALSRVGDNLVLTFDDGASIQLENFYTVYSRESMPTFQVDGTEIPGSEFFAALNEDLMPAAGPAAGAAARAARYNEFGNSDLMDGINHLDGLDAGSDGAPLTTAAVAAVSPNALGGDDAAVVGAPLEHDTVSVITDDTDLRDAGHTSVAMVNAAEQLG
ncbi:MAG: hypothetical protein SOZ85_01780, partial [Desulfovibrio porci]|nr:hypothetical protein [Desulfovibrio porci]